ncbi:MAG: hypothetical protein LBE91_05530 [Tannerella sp.]|jgi:hypothetical protein|nr:hypothetical protein [Tannerella sp.]
MKKIAIILSILVLITNSYGQTTDTARNTNVISTQKEYFLGKMKVLLKQQQSNGIDFYCKAKIIVTENEIIIDSICFSPYPVGGDYGISNAVVLENHLIFTKHGDYDGRTIIINHAGKIFDIIGGENYIDTESNLLFSLYESDLNGFAIFDLKSDSILWTEDKIPDIYEYPMSIHKIENKYFIIRENVVTGAKSIWEFDMEMKKIMESDFGKETINARNKLQILLKDDVINCICKE